MDYRIDKKTGKKVSLLGLGLMRLPLVDKDSSKIDYDAAFEIVDTCYQGGVNYFDTAYNYHGGNSEAFAGKALAGYARDSYTIATKLPLWMAETADDAKRIVENQFKNLKMDHIDYYLVHAMDSEVQEILRKFDLFPWLDGLRKQGAIGHLGFSFHDEPEVLDSILKEYTWDFCQIQLNYIDWEFQKGKEQYELIERAGLPCLVMEPVRGGRLARLGDEADALLKARQPDASIASWAMRYVGAMPNNLTILSGMSTVAQAQDNLKTFEGLKALSTDDLAVLGQAAGIFKTHNTIPCTACQYCMPCPSGCNIPGLLSLLNDCAFDGSLFQFGQKYAEFPTAENAHHCVQCSQCEAVCPQHIKIMSHMEKINADVSK